MNKFIKYCFNEIIDFKVYIKIIVRIILFKKNIFYNLLYYYIY